MFNIINSNFYNNCNMIIIARSARRVLRQLRLPPAARVERRKDRSGPSGSDPGIGRAIAEAVGWLGRAEDNSRLRDGGVAHHFSLIDGWGSSYPETTGYIVPTLLAMRGPGGRCRRGSAGESAHAGLAGRDPIPGGRVPRGHD